MTGEQAAPEATPAAPPVLRVVNPDATPEEIAALVAVFASLGGAPEQPAPPRSLWASPARQVRRTAGAGVAAGRGAWRASGLPQ
ncbi:acyl-CoA carboxylase subunit epsilon [Nocardioides sp. GY 10113]|uniref:acyl-CoA carboxylase subunit epsilon n=1 Tax=Nocardioides sp. GY 10113 TaxID=2569761 RepID=UPI0010A908E9|nr:acyl-CoA carboxylase subunit epsilon [Nocardioides sp. GY 10113]TIC86726.1 acyl-CoA carboxylase subunit epsilon [Nocardioides sp. GY 10113]